MNAQKENFSYWKDAWKKFLKHRLGALSLIVVLLFCAMGIFAPFIASSKPILLVYDGVWYFPLFHYLFFQGFFTKNIDLFFNLMAILVPIFFAAAFFVRKRKAGLKLLLLLFLLFQFSFFAYLSFFPVKDPASDPMLAQQRNLALQRLRSEGKYPTWQFDLNFMNSYEKLNQVLKYRRLREQDERIERYAEKYREEKLARWLAKQSLEYKNEWIKQGGKKELLPSDQEIEESILKSASQEELRSASSVPTLWQMQKAHEEERMKNTLQTIAKFESGDSKDALAYERAKSSLQYLLDKRLWLESQSLKISFEVMPLFRPFHWEDDAGGEQKMNQFLPWWELTRINRKDLMAALIFGVRISLVVGILAVSLALAIGIPVGSFAGYYGGKFDIVVSRLMEIWESMPTFFMLLFVVAILQSKSIFIVIAVVGIFGWTGFSRYIRGEFFKQRNLPYVEACHALGFRDSHIIFSHILPNAIPPVLTLLPFAVLGAITSEAGLSFLGLGEEGSCSWGVLMDEGRSAFPGESYLLWPPAILLTVLLVAIALVGDALRDVLDPKMSR